MLQCSKNRRSQWIKQIMFKRTTKQKAKNVLYHFLNTRQSAYKNLYDYQNWPLKLLKSDFWFLRKDTLTNCGAKNEN
jgi:hypothetical protein